MRTDEKLKELVERLHINCGDIHEAARWCGVSPAFVMSWMNDDEEAAKQLEEAKRVGYGGIESEIIRRAVKGIEEDIYYKGEIVGHKQVYSDGLLGKLAEAKLPEYSKKEGGSGASFYGPTQINLMPRATNYDEWLAMKDTTLANRATEALPAPDTKVPEILQGDYVEVPDRMPSIMHDNSDMLDEHPLKALADLL